MWIIISGDRNYGGTKIWGFFSEIQYEISEIRYENIGIFSKNPRISYHINMSRKVNNYIFVSLESCHGRGRRSTVPILPWRVLLVGSWETNLDTTQRKFLDYCFPELHLIGLIVG